MTKTLFLSSLIVGFTLLVQAQQVTAPVPPMGWNSYNSYGATVREDEVLANAEFMAKNLVALGWQYIVIDFCWFYPHHPLSNQDNPPQFRLPKDGSYVPWLAMDKYGRLLPDHGKFPSAINGTGFKSLADRIHSMGLKFGIHVMRGIPRQSVWEKSPVAGTIGITADMIADTNSICGWLNNMYGIDMSKKGAQEYLSSLFELYALWGVDFVKIDDLSNPYYKAEIEGYRKAIQNSGREIVFSTSPGATPVAMGDHISKQAQMWRISADFWDTWSQLHEMFGYASQWDKFRSAGHWPDLDMLQLGRLALRGPVGNNRECRFTADEQRTHFTLWCISQSPLFFGGDFLKSSDNAIAIIKNPYLIEIDQKSVNARQVSRNNEQVVWVSELKDKNMVNIALFNIGNTPQTVKVQMAALGLGRNLPIFDVWEQKSAGKTGKTFEALLAPHACKLIQIKQ